MPQSGLGLLLRKLRDNRGLSLRELGQLTEIDHAYIHRLETGEKESPSGDLFTRLLRYLKPTDREAEMAKWLVDHPDVDPNLVQFVLADPTIEADIFIAATAMRHRGSARPDPAQLIARVQRAFEDDE